LIQDIVRNWRYNSHLSVGSPTQILEKIGASFPPAPEPEIVPDHDRTRIQFPEKNLFDEILGGHRRQLFVETKLKNRAGPKRTQKCHSFGRFCQEKRSVIGDYNALRMRVKREHQKRALGLPCQRQSVGENGLLTKVDSVECSDTNHRRSGECLASALGIDKELVLGN
jgi:hypothetical protein